MNFPLPGGDPSLPGGDTSRPGGGDEPLNMTCYKGGDLVFANHQICNVTSTLAYFILSMHCTKTLIYI